jgi:hypothetical protein
MSINSRLPGPLALTTPVFTPATVVGACLKTKLGCLYITYQSWFVLHPADRAATLLNCPLSGATRAQKPFVLQDAAI